MRAAFALLPLTASIAAPAAAAQETRLFDVTGSTLSTSLPSLAQQGQVSITVADSSLWNLTVQPVHGRMSIERALAILLQGSGAAAVQINAASWRIERLRAPRTANRFPYARSITPRLTRAAITHDEQAAPHEEIIVTASKADLPFAHYAGSAAFMQGEDLNFGGERGTESLLRHSASLSSTHLGSGRNKLFIRGIADSSFTGPTQSTVGQYLGDIRLSYNAPDPDLRLYDLDGVEVLEGPQGTLYGAGSLGGIIRMVPRAPRPDQLEMAAIAGVSLTQDGEPGGDIAAILNMPLSQRGGGHALRFVGYMVSDGGYIDNPLLGKRDINRTHVRGARATLRFHPNEDFTIDLGGIYQNILSDDAQYADRKGQQGSDGLSRFSSITEEAEADYRMASIVLAYDFGDVRLQSSNAYIRHHLIERFDASLSPDLPRAIDQRNHTEMWVSETRLSRPFYNGYGWVLGASLIDNQAQQLREADLTMLRAPLTGVSNHIKEFTAFANGTLAITPRLTGSAGLRFSQSWLNGQGEDVPDTIALIAANRAIVAKRTEKDLLPSASLLYQAPAHIRLYLSYSEGFRPGGLAISRSFVERFQHDRVKTWEAGMRWGDSGSNPFNASLAISHSDWSDIQADFIDIGGFPTTANIGDGRIISVSANLAYRLTPNLSFDLGAVYNHSRITRQSAALSGLVYFTSEPISHIPNVARTSLRAALSYAAPLGKDDLRLNGWAQYVGPSRLGIGPILGEEQGDYLDSGLAARLGNSTRGFSLTLTNPFNSRGNRFALGTPFRGDGSAFITPLRPRTIRLAVDYRY